MVGRSLWMAALLRRTKPASAGDRFALIRIASANAPIRDR
jgi:hypothetical protein